MVQNSIKSLFLFVLFVALSACSSLHEQKNIQLRAEQATQKSSQSTQFMLQRAKAKLQKSHTESLAFYAPTYLEQAQQAYEKANKLYLEKESSDAIKLYAQRSIEWVEAGLRNKKMVKEYLSASLANRTVLIELDAVKYFPEAYQKIEAKHLELIKQVEMRKEIDAQKREKDLLSDMRALEVATIGQVHLSQSYQMLNQAKTMGAEKNLPATYQSAFSQLKKTEAFIQQNPRDAANIRGLAKDSLFTTERLFSLARLAHKIQQNKESKLEDLILEQEALFQKMAQSLNYKDIRNLSLQDQSLLLSQYAKKLTSSQYAKVQPESNKKELEKWKRKVVLLQAEIRRLEK